MKIYIDEVARKVEWVGKQVLISQWTRVFKNVKYVLFDLKKHWVLQKSFSQGY